MTASFGAHRDAVDAGVGELVRLHPETIEAVARAVFELMRAEGAVGRETPPTETDADLLTAAQVACRFGVSRDFVYAHAAELGVVKIGTGSKPRLRFDRAVVEQALSGAALSSPAFKGDGRARTQARAIVADGAALEGLDALPAAWRNAISDGRAT